MQRRVVEVDGGVTLAYGHYGRPVVAFPSENGQASDWEERGMVDALGDLLEGGRLKLYCVPSFDSESWTRRDLPLEERAKRHGHYEWWILSRLVPFVQADSSTRELVATGCSFGAYHAANFCLKRADLFPLAIGLSGVYDVAVQGGGERGDAVYFSNPMDYVAHLHGDHLAWLRGQASLLLVCGQGQWEDTTGALESTKRFAALLAAKGIHNELDLWGHDVPHDWPSWRRQIAHHLSRVA
jgi:esterase/lipase superfamily enzyme